MNQQKVKIAPSILSADFARLGEEVQAIIACGADWVHLDVMDGSFVPNITFGAPIIAKIRSITKATFDCHLMIINPDEHIQSFAAAGADIITVHVEACVHLDRTLKLIRSFGKKAGVSLNPATPVQSIENVLDSLDLVLIMSVNPGFGGQKFIAKSLDKIGQVRKIIGNRDIDIEVDGGVTEDNAKEIIDAGASALVAGTAVFGTTNYTNAINNLRC